MDTLHFNPCDALERPKVQQSVARGYSAGDVRRLLDFIPDTVAGRRDSAIILTLVLTGRRREEVISLKPGSITIDDGKVFYASTEARAGRPGDVSCHGPRTTPSSRRWRTAGSSSPRCGRTSLYGRPAPANAE